MNDPDVNLYNEHDFDTRYFSVENLQPHLPDGNTFSVLHVNIRSMKKNFNNFKYMLSMLKYEFKVICITETWCNDENMSTNSNFQLPNYSIIHQMRADHAGGGICMFIHNSLSYKLRADLSKNDADCESLCIELSNRTTKNIIVNTFYRQPAGKIKPFKDHLKTVFSKLKHSNKKLYLTGDFNLNLLDYTTNTKVKTFVNLLFQHGLIPLINKPTRVTRRTATVIDLIITNQFDNSSLTTGIIKTQIADHFLIFLVSKDININVENNKSTIVKRRINDITIQTFKNLLKEMDWELVYQTENANEAYKVFLKLFIKQYEKAFPKVEIKIKTKSLSLLSPWMTKGLLKSSKKKQKLYEKVLKRRTYTNEKKYKNYKKLFECVKYRSKKLYYSTRLDTYVGNAKKTWDIIKEVIGKTKLSKNDLPKRLIHEQVETFDKAVIADNFNKFFVNIGPKLASIIPESSATFESYLNPFNSIMENKNLTLKELHTALSKSNKSVGFDEISINVVKQVFDVIQSPLCYIFNVSLKHGVFPDKLKIARVTPIFKTGDKFTLSNYRPISILPCFSKLLERVMYNRLYAYLTTNNILYEKQFGFQINHSTDHAIIQLVNEILHSFDENKFTLGVFIDLSKAFDTVNHQILLSKLEHYGVKSTNLKWFSDYLTNRKQFISYDNETTEMDNITCGVPQGSILGPLLFLIYINDIHNSSDILDFTLFADDTNLFFSHKDIKVMFETVNSELSKIHEWFKANKLSLNTGKTKYMFFHKLNVTDNIPLKLPNLVLNNNKIKREYSMKFLGVLLDECLTWKKHIEMIENKISKNIGILYKAKFLLNQKCLKSIYFSFIHVYINYANIAWSSTNPSKLTKILNKQKHASRIILSEERNAHARPLMKKLKVLNTFQLNIYQILLFMFKTKNEESPNIFSNQFSNVNHKYPTKFSENNFKQPKRISNSTYYSIVNRGPYLWNNVLSNDEKSISSYLQFKKSIKQKLLECETEEKYF